VFSKKKSPCYALVIEKIAPEASLTPDAKRVGQIN